MLNKKLFYRIGIAWVVCLSILAGAGHLTLAQVDGDVYLPLTMKNYPFTPSAPALNPISNGDGDGSYTVSWSSSEGANTYTLEEDDSDTFSSPTTVYEGTSTSKEISGRDIGTYYYRVMASNVSASSAWSHVESVEVTAALAECPQAGVWRGTTSQGRRVYFSVQNSPQCQIESDSLVFGWDTYGTGCYYDAYTRFYVPFEIIDGHFDASNVSDKLDELTGTFTSPNMVEGSFSVSYTVTSPYIRTCTASGTWDAQPIRGVDGEIYAIQILNDGDILIGGNFSQVNQTARNNIARLNPDGTLDGNFSADVNSYVYSIAQQADGKILIGGSISHVNGQVVNGIARLNDNGSLDNSFNSDIISINTSAWAHIYTMDVLSDGDILVGGEFDEVDGQERNYVARLNPDGSLDSNFNANLDMSYYIVNSIAVDEDMVYIAGEFVAGDDYWTGPRNLARLSLVDGSLDESFEAEIEDLTLWEVKQIGVQPDGKIIVLHSNHIVRLNQDGTADASFSGPSLDAFPITLAIQANGKILVGGWFSDFVIQLESNGTQNLTFNPDPNNGVLALALQSDGKILMGGEFTRIGAEVRHGIARLNPDGSVDTTFDPGLND
jgi:uncharacterized delta-60 repeat protein